MGIGLRGDFIGFSFNGIHSSELGITRVSDGSRYNDNLLPTSQDKTAAIPGGDGTYYWETFHTQKQFNIPIAFDGLTEEQYRRLKQVFNTKEKIAPLIFDEAPYKYYMAKPTGTPQLKTICFGEGSDRIYKGEGTIQFTAYYPYAKSVHKWLDEYSDDKYPNKNEWAAVSGMLNNNKDAEGNVKYDSAKGNTITLYNPGDIEADFYLSIAFPEGKDLELASISLLSKEGNSYAILSFDGAIPRQSKDEVKDSGIRINTKTNLIEGIDADGKLTGTLYNKHIDSGEFFKIPLGEWDLSIGGAEGSIEYQYIYY